MSLNFPQPCYPSGWWSATLAGKQAVREFRQDAAERPAFDTRYYTGAIHQAAMAQPRFMLEP